jgi:hypothetical protein
MQLFRCHPTRHGWAGESGGAASLIARQRGSLRITTAIAQAPVIRKILRHLGRSADPPLIAPAEDYG